MLHNNNQNQKTPAEDPRHIDAGLEIPAKSYCDQPYVVITKGGDWLCLLTTGKGQEGEGGQHIVATLSQDRGRTCMCS